MRQKVLICAALLHDPEILILDEPLSGLDVGSVLVTKVLLAGLAARGRAILYSTHLLDVAERLCRRDERRRQPQCRPGAAFGRALRSGTRYTRGPLEGPCVAPLRARSGR
jgi:energy-coupling factor transporter ATP-binding protein EcfA2